MRPAGITCNMIGLYSTGRAKGPPPPKTDSVAEPHGSRISSSGILLAHVGVTWRARDLFPAGPAGDAAFGAHLDELGERLRAAERNARYERDSSPSPGVVRKPALFRDGKRISWLSLRTLRCAGCRVTLLGPSDECVRADARRRRRRGRKALAALPPPVAGAVHERPVCAACLPRGLNAKGGA